jgi:hypothetical protein
MTPVAGLQVHWPGSGQAEGSPCADAGCCLIVVTDATSNTIITTRMTKKVLFFSYCR